MRGPAGPPPPPPTDPQRLWPEGQFDAFGPGSYTVQPNPIVEGFAYPAHQVTWDGSRLRFQLLTSEPWTAWCNIQTSYQHGDHFDCDVEAEARKVTGAGGTAGRCSYSPTALCACNATGCGANVQVHSEPYDIAFYGDHADGSALAHNIRLRPANP